MKAEAGEKSFSDSEKQELLKKFKEEAMVEHNFDKAKKFFSYQVLRRKLNSLVSNIIGTRDE